MGSFQSSIEEVCIDSLLINFQFSVLFIWNFSYNFQCNTNNYNLQRIWNCYNGTKAALGRRILKNHGDLTNLIDLSFVPSIEIDQVS